MHYIFSHKDYIPTIIPESYKIINIGNEEIHLDGVLKDLDGDNIHHLNPDLNELTGFYYIWKNLPDYDGYVGIASYRRYLINNFTQNMFTNKELDEIFKDYNIITSPICGIEETVYEQLESTIKSLGFYYTMEEVENKFKELYPEYIDIYNQTLYQGHEFYSCNMFIMKYEDFIDYTKWILDILIPVAEHLYKFKYPSRFPGFIGERLFTVWINIKKSKNPNYKIYENTHVKLITPEENKYK